MSYKNQNPPRWDQHITVAKDGGQFTSIKDAVSFANTLASTSNRICIQVMPGDYTENNPVVLSDYVGIVGTAGHYSTKMLASNSDQHGIVCGSYCYVDGISVLDTTGVGASGFHIPSGKQSVELNNTCICDCDIGWLCDSADSNIMHQSSVMGGTSTSAIKVTASAKLIATTFLVGSSSTVANAFHCDGGLLQVGTAGLLGDGAGSITNGIYIENNGTVNIGTASLIGCTNAINVAATDGVLFASAIISSLSQTYDVLLQGGSSTIVRISGGEIDTTKISKTSASIFTALYSEQFAGDRGTTIRGELHVGSPDDPAETVLGEGDSSVVDMVVKTYDGAATYVDHTSDASDGTLFTAFPGLGTGNALLIGNRSRKFPGWKDLVDTACVPGSGELVVELSDGAGGWNVVEVMTTDADPPYEAHAQEIFERVQASHVRLNTLGTAWSSWATDTYDSDTCYWIRIRIATAAITTAPILGNGSASLKCHTNRFEANGDGFTERFGEARALRPMLSHQRLTDDLSGASPGNGALAFTTTITLTPAENRFADNSVDGFGMILPVPAGIDTSMPLSMEVCWVPRGTTTSNDVELELSWRIMKAGTAGLADGDLVDGTLTDDASSSVVESMVAGDSDRLIRTTFSANFPEAIPGDFIAWRLYRDATAGNADDTHADNIDIASIQIFGYFWR